MNSDDAQKISRKKFLRICGSVIAGGSILGFSGMLINKRSVQRKTGRAASVIANWKQAIESPYKLVSSFRAPDRIGCIEMIGDRLLVAVPNNILVYDQSGSLLNMFPVASNVRDVAVSDGLIYLLYPLRIEVYDAEGEWIRDWEACSEQSDYCSFTVSPDHVFVTDAAGKNICQYTKEGGFVRFINSPDGFIIPSYTFGIAYIDGVIYCSNSGRHRIECYTPDGKYLEAFGKAGGAAGMFCGCCNPVHITRTPAGEIITSEKGNPRISCYGKDGKFRNILLNAQMLGGGNTAYGVKVHNDKIFVAGRDTVSTFRYDGTMAAKSSCAGCKASCPLREGVMI